MYGKSEQVLEKCKYKKKSLKWVVIGKKGTNFWWIELENYIYLYKGYFKVPLMLSEP